MLIFGKARATAMAMPQDHAAAARRTPFHRLVWTLKYAADPRPAWSYATAATSRAASTPTTTSWAHTRPIWPIGSRSDGGGSNVQPPMPTGTVRPLELDVANEELTPIRIYVRGVEIVGKALIRPFDPRGKL